MSMKTSWKYKGDNSAPIFSKDCYENRNILLKLLEEWTMEIQAILSAKDILPYKTNSKEYASLTEVWLSISNARSIIAGKIIKTNESEIDPDISSLLICFSDFMKLSKKEKTFANYQAIINKVLSPYFKKNPLDVYELDQDIIDNILLAESGRKKYYQRNIYYTIIAFLKYCHDLGFYGINANDFCFNDAKMFSR